MKKLTYFFLSVCLFFFITACNDDEGAAEPTIQPATLSSMTPTSGPKTTLVTFAGTNFGSDINDVQVFFDDIEAQVQSVTDTNISAIVPPRAFGGVVKIIVRNQELTGLTFEYIVVDVNVSTVAGSTEGFADGSATTAQFDNPVGIAIDASGNQYLADSFNSRIRKISPNGQVSTFAGSTQGFADGIGENALFSLPADVAADASGNVYVADFLNHRIRKISPSGVVSTLAGSTEGFADGIGTDAQFDKPRGIAVDNSGNIYVTEVGNDKIRKITPDGLVSTIAGSTEGFSDGTATTAQFCNPNGIVIDATGNIYVSDNCNFKIRKITPEGNVTTLAGSMKGQVDGVGSTAQFSSPTGIDIDALGNLYVADFSVHKIRKVTSDGKVTTIAGSTLGFADGTGSNAQFSFPSSIAIDDRGDLFIADSGNHKIRKITLE